MLMDKKLLEQKKALRQLLKLDFVLPEDIPDIDLYMDQVTTFMDQHMKNNLRHDDDKTLTKTMINNYTKNHLLLELQLNLFFDIVQEVVDILLLRFSNSQLFENQ